MNDLQTALDTLTRVANAAESGGLLVVTVMHTSKSNMSFRLDIRLYYTTARGVDSLYLNWAYSQLMGAKQDDNGLVKWSGLGIARDFEAANNIEALIRQHLNREVKVNFKGVF
tara:strand:+ start:121 stop:459 length:339 start_codon:yes stop_codon:yes gene_type:complete